MSFSSGDVIADKYRIVRMIGRGGVGEVYEGENLRIRRKVAIKTLRAEFLAKSDVVQRFEREAQAAGRIGSAHIVEVLDLGDMPDGSRYLVMEFLEGQTLSKHIKGAGRLGAVEAAQILMQILEGLGAAHAAGIVHRDLKPANVVLTTKAGEHFAKILDFGVSKFNTLASDELAMTKTGAVVGTPYYMAPEQAKGARGVDGRADLYAVGVIAYECVTGQVPFSAQTFNELLFKIVLETPPPIESFVSDLDPDFASIVRKAMAREPNQRFQTAAELQQSLSDWLVRVTSGKLGMTLAQTTSFQGGGATMILDPSYGTPASGAHAAPGSGPSTRVMPQMPNMMAPASSRPSHPSGHALPPSPPLPPPQSAAQLPGVLPGAPPAAWSNESALDPRLAEPTPHQVPQKSSGTAIAIGAVVVAIAVASIAGFAIFRSTSDDEAKRAEPSAATTAVEAASATKPPPAESAAPQPADAKTGDPDGVVTAEPAPPSAPSTEVAAQSPPAQRPIGGPLPRGPVPSPPAPPPPGPGPGTGPPAKSGRTISGDL